MDNLEKIIGHNKKLQPFFFAAILVGIMVVVYLIFKPFFITFFLAVVFVVAFKNYYNKILGFLNNKKSLSSFITVLLIVLLILVPLTLIAMKVFSEASAVYSTLNVNSFSWLNGLKNWSSESLQNIFNNLHITGNTDVFSADLSLYMKAGAGWIVSHFQGIFSGLSTFLFDFILFIIMLYYLFQYGAEIKKFAIKLSPLPNNKDIKIIDRLEHSTNSILRGSIIIAMSQGVIAGFGFAIFGLPQPALWGVMAALCALIPGFGTALVMIPSIIYLAFFGSLFSTLGLLLWALLAVGLIDNFLGPKLMSKGSHIHPFLIFLSVLGGLMFFGPIGFLIGPLSLSLLYTLFELYFIDDTVKN